MLNAVGYVYVYETETFRPAFLCRLGTGYTIHLFTGRPSRRHSTSRRSSLTHEWGNALAASTANTQSRSK